MSEPIITLDRLIEHFEIQCENKFGTLDMAKQLLKTRYNAEPSINWPYFECLKAVSISDGSVEDANAQLTECLRRYAQSIQHGRNQQERGKRAG